MNHVSIWCGNEGSHLAPESTNVILFLTDAVIFLGTTYGHLIILEIQDGYQDRMAARFAYFIYYNFETKQRKPTTPKIQMYFPPLEDTWYQSKINGKTSVLLQQYYSYLQV